MTSGRRLTAGSGSKDRKPEGRRQTLPVRDAHTRTTELVRASLQRGIAYRTERAA